MRSPTDSQPCLCKRPTCPMLAPHLDWRSQKRWCGAQAWARAESSALTTASSLSPRVSGELRESTPLQLAVSPISEGGSVTVVQIRDAECKTPDFPASPQLGPTHRHRTQSQALVTGHNASLTRPLPPTRL